MRFNSSGIHGMVGPEGILLKNHQGQLRLTGVRRTVRSATVLKKKANGKRRSTAEA